MMQTTDGKSQVTTSQGLDSRRMFAALLTHDPGALARIVVAMANAGDIGWLEAFRESDTAVALAQKLKGVDRVRPIEGLASQTLGAIDFFRLLHAIEENGTSRQTNALIDSWASLLDLDTRALQDDLGLTSCKTVMASYIRLGAHPNGAALDDDDGLTSLGRRLSANYVEASFNMLDILGERDELPMHASGGKDREPVSLFAAITNAVYSAKTADRIVNYLCARPIPDAWTREIAVVLQDVRSGMHLPADFLTACRLLSLAQFPSTESFVDNIRGRGADLAFVLATSVDSRAALVLERLCATGVDIDSLPCTLFDSQLPKAREGRATGTMLHAAARANNLQGMQVLLAAGADPTNVVTARAGGPTVHATIGKNAFEIAEGAAQAALNAWGARAALQTALRAPRRGIEGSAS